MLDAYEREAMILDAIDAQLAKLREKYRKRARVVKCAECERYFGFHPLKAGRRHLEGCD
jgi:hypothetical protein